MYLVTWDNKEIIDGDMIDITPGELVCNSEKEILETIDDILFDEAVTHGILVSPNLHIYKLDDITSNFAPKINELKDIDRLKQQKKEYEELIKEVLYVKYLRSK